MVCKEDIYIYRSCVQSSLIDLTLKRGSLLGAGGALLLVLGGTFIPLETLSLWGAPFFLLGLFFIALGFVPYKKLGSLQLKPHEIHCSKDTLTFLRQGKPFFLIDTTSIEKICYVEREHLYGIGIWLKKPVQSQVKFLQKNFASFVLHPIQRIEGCDLFLPFFTHKVAKEVAESVHIPKQPEKLDLG